MNKLIIKTPREAFELMNSNNNYLVIDIRKIYEFEYKSINVKNVKNIDINNFNLKNIDIKSKSSVFIIDSTGLQSQSFAQSLIELGYQNIFVISGGILEWQRDKLPMKYKNNSFIAKPSFYNSKPTNHVKTSLN